MPALATHPRFLFRRLAAGAQLAAVTALVTLMAAPPATALPEAVAAPASIQVVDAPGIALHIPADGRVNGDGFAAQITGYRLANQVG